MEKQIQVTIEKLANYNQWTVSRYEIGKFEEIFENYLGIIVPVVLFGYKNKGKSAFVEHVVVKVRPEMNSIDAINVVKMAFKAEIFTYSNLRRLYKSIYTFNVDELIPECFYIDATLDKEVLVLKDMRSLGFERCLSNDSFFDLDHSVAALKALAQYHALNMVTMEKNDYILHSMTKYNHPKHTPFVKNIFLKFIPLFTGNKYERYLKKIDAEYVKISAILPDTRMCVAHNDYSKHNIMFKYEGRKPLQTCILDFQNTKVTSPANDVINFIFTSVDVKVRRQHYHYLLEVYHNALLQVMSQTDLKPDQIYSREELNRDLKAMIPTCFPCLFLSFALWLGLIEEGLLSSKKKCTEKEMILARSYFVRIITDILKDLNDFGLITV